MPRPEPSSRLQAEAEASMVLQLYTEQLQQIQRHGERHYPNEGVGLILGRACSGAREVVSVMPLINRSAEHIHRYHIDPRDMLAAEVEAERLNLEILGVFHSHPDIPAEPSAHDLETAFPWFSYVITSIKDGEARRTRSWRLHAEPRQWTEEAIAVQDSDKDAECR
jgi:proteasome lid subunit RPN8/RPN11